MYCRWLSEREGIAEDQMCYPPIPEILKCADGLTPLRLPADPLSRKGYRLPARLHTDGFRIARTCDPLETQPPP